MKKHVYQIGYIAIILAILLLPFAGMVWARNDVTIENTALSEWPDLMVEDGPNVAYLSGMGDYFEDHFAYRQEIITANAQLRAAAIGVSATDQVVVGTDEWLYYSGTLDDYLGRNQLSPRGVQNIAHNVSLMQQYVESKGSKFIFTVAPNKNSLYDQNMPYYYIEGETSTIDTLVPELVRMNVHYADLFSLYEEQDEILYFKRDTHWNAKGALLAYNSILDALDKQHEDYEDAAYVTKTDHIGDLDTMLYPAAPQLEDEYYYQESDTGYTYEGEFESVEDSWIHTTDPSEEEVLLMYRDSFGNALIPFLADEFGSAYFSKLVPYNLGNLDEYDPDYVIVERAERHLPYLGENPPIMEGPPREEIDPGEVVETETTITTRMNGPYLMIEGVLDEAYANLDAKLYVSLQDSTGSRVATYEAFHTTVEQAGGTSDYGYLLYLHQDSFPLSGATINVIVTTGETLFTVGMETVSIDEAEGA